jgi:choline dehydrogenase-like flavoprotein
MKEGVEECEYVVVGSGAGGGTVAARLAEAGCSVVLLEAGRDPCSEDAVDSGDSRALATDYRVPAFHVFASEAPAIAWNYYVRHSSNEAEERLDPKYVPDRRGFLYPRASALGGCTAHNAMIFVYPHDDDFTSIALATGDDSWRAERMRTYFERIERCRHRPLLRWLAALGFNPSRHGWKGWLPAETAFPEAAVDSGPIRQLILDAVFEVLREEGQAETRARWFLEAGMDPNDWRLVRDNATGIRYLPLSTKGHARVGARERVADVARRFPDRLKIVVDALATRVVLDEQRRAVGVDYLEGARLYRAHANPSDERGRPRSVRASREVIVACGAFNSPQLLMLSGIGPRAQLERVGIPVRHDLPGVGRNLQDRYEIGVVNRATFPRWDVFAGARFARDDPQFVDWERHRRGIYATNGSVMTVFRRSEVARQAGELPDLFCMSLLTRFTGYFPGYSRSLAEHLNYLTWVVLKAHTRNRSGQVTLRTADPRDPPAVDFNYFEQGGDHDLDAVVDGIRFTRRLTAPLKKQGYIAAEELPGPEVETDEDLRAFVRTNAWGHHASCTCPIGVPSEGGVLTSDFRVHGTSGLRVVDASVFPRIPGFFIASAVYMIGEKAADVILAERARAPAERAPHASGGSQPS